jgi:hypothetical protein
LHWLMTHNIVLWQVSVPCNKIFVSHWTTNNTTLNPKPKLLVCLIFSCFCRC